MVGLQRRRQAREAHSEFLTYLNRTYGTPLAEQVMTSREAMWVNSTAAWEANALRWALVGYAASGALLILVWIVSGASSRKPEQV